MFKIARWWMQAHPRCACCLRQSFLFQLLHSSLRNALKIRVLRSVAWVDVHGLWHQHHGLVTRFCILSHIISNRIG